MSDSKSLLPKRLFSSHFICSDRSLFPLSPAYAFLKSFSLCRHSHTFPGCSVLPQPPFTPTTDNCLGMFLRPLRCQKLDEAGCRSCWMYWSDDPGKKHLNKKFFLPVSWTEVVPSLMVQYEEKRLLAEALTMWLAHVPGGYFVTVPSASESPSP